MRVFGIIGYPLGHSWSAKYFAEKFQREGIHDAVYKMFPLESIADFPKLLEAEPDLVGLNVTIPYKEQVIPFLDGLEGAAAENRAVNVIGFDRSGSKLKLTGHNTDVAGFEQSLLDESISLPQKALVLGTGGASKAVTWVLKKHGCDFLLVSRRPSGENTIGYDDLSASIIQEHTLIINTTPLGMVPNIDTCPYIPYQYLGSGHTLFDLVYNPAETLFLKKGKEMGCKTVNGSGMLTGQAIKAWEIWNR
ncbi:MAG: shikimate dehydrogenase [Bacteroidales bacterium]|nr:shikimate dehydrogenase [Bacteroidales bacterium]